MKWLRSIACFPIRLYQWTLSPLKRALLGPGAGCRFQPTCSNYAIEAILRHGIFMGMYLGAKRILRCHPWGGQGWDPVPPTGKDSPAEQHPSDDPSHHDLKLTPCSTESPTGHFHCGCDPLSTTSHS